MFLTVVRTENIKDTLNVIVEIHAEQCTKYWGSFDVIPLLGNEELDLTVTANTQLFLWARRDC